MRRILALSSLAVLFLVGCASKPAAVKEKWLYLGGSFNSEQNVNRFISIMNDAKKAGVTHIAAAEGVCNRPDNAPKEYPEYVQRVLAEAKKLNMQVVPHVYPIGYGGAWLWYDGNLGAGIPGARRPLYRPGWLCRSLRPDPDLQLKNGGFENADGDKLADWQQPGPGKLTFVDKRGETQRQQLSAHRRQGHRPRIADVQRQALSILSPDRVDEGTGPPI